MSTSSLRVILIRRDKIKRYTKFLMVGGMNAAVDLFVLNVLLILFTPSTTIELTACNSVAVASAIVNSYLWNRHWTFVEVSDGSLREKMLFFLQALVNILVNDVVVVYLTRQFAFAHWGSPFVESNLAKGVAMFLSSSISYLLLSVVVFSKRLRASSQI